MKCDRASELLTDWMSGVLAEQEAAELEAHMADCRSCRAEAEALRTIWDDLDAPAIAVPTERMRARFHAALAAYDERASAGVLERLVGLWPGQPALRFASGVALIVVGGLIGHSLSGPSEAELTAMREEMRTLSLALLEHQSASERLRGVDVSRRAAFNDRAVDALIATVRNDTNVNVRLAAVEALSSRLDQPRIGMALIDALNEQDAPLIQVALAQALLEAGVADSIPVIERLISRESLDPSVRSYLSTLVEERASEASANRL